MKQKTLLFFVMSLFITSLFAQQNKKQKETTGYAITANEKGGRNWKEVKLVNIVTGEELQSVYNSKAELQPMNARTGKPAAKKENLLEKELVLREVREKKVLQEKRIVNLDQELNTVQPQELRIPSITTHNDGTVTINQGNVTVIRRVSPREQSDKPFATNSAAMAYDKKHERLYYTPMGINQLRYIDLRSKTPAVFYFEDEAFGTVSNFGDAQNQITRMVIASDGNGYALTNDGNHLIKFTTGKKPVITDMGALTDDAANAKNSVHSRGGYGGDMIADNKENLYLITANRNVYKIDISTKVAKHLGAIKGLPQGFSTNGAMVEEGTKVIVASSENTIGYYRFDLNTMQAEKVSSSSAVYNASDLANGNLVNDKKKKEKKEEPVEEVKPDVQPDVASKTARSITDELNSNSSISVFPNPVTNKRARISFDDVPAGKYSVQVIDLGGKLVTNQQVNVQAKGQLSEIKLPASITPGTYLVNVSNEGGKLSKSVKLIVE
ncbi:MAG: T9SS type A sorting domain-containing protein [Bacteroidetes bacterium]|nr:MAG: T9SS type A sorting domain-containing protein [Bacteroidota bacterium]